MLAQNGDKYGKDLVESIQKQVRMSKVQVSATSFEGTGVWKELSSKCLFLSL